MKSILLLAGALILSNMPSSAQHAKFIPGINVNAERKAMLTKPWKIDSVEVFGVAKAPNAKQKNDGITFNADGTFFITSDGVASTGTWTSNGSIYINTVSKAATAGAADEKMMFKAIRITATRLVLDYQTPDLITYRYTYEPKN